MARNLASNGRYKSSGRDLSRAGSRLLLLSALLAIPLTSCQGFKGTMMDHQEAMSDFFNKPDPLTVVKTTSNSDRRAKFLGRIEEPLANGGTHQQQDEVITFLRDTAANDPAPHCRLQAIRALGSFQDPRAVKALQTAYDNSTTFSPLVNTAIRQRVLKSLGEMGTPAARTELIRVARAGAKEDTFYDEQLTLDERMTAVRALENYKETEVAQALFHLMKTEKDVAIRNRAHQSLQAVTGKRLPNDVEQWQQAIYNVPADGGTPEAKKSPLQLLSGN